MLTNRWDIVLDQFHKILLDNMFDAVFAVDTDIRITYWNRSCQRISGFSAAEMVGQEFYRTPLGNVHDYEGDGNNNPRGGLRIVVETGMPGTWKGYIKRKTGQRVPIESRISPIFNGQQDIAGAVEVFRDCSSQVLMEQAHTEALQTARHDQLTGLLNRAAISELLKTEINRSRRYGQMFSMIMMDLDYFKSVNDDFGHDVGDKLLAKIGCILLHNLRTPDMAGRWGGEEFVILAPGSDCTAAYKLAERMRQYVLEVSIPQIPRTVTASFGIAQVVSQQSADELLAATDKALYRAKKAGRNRSLIGDNSKE